MGSPTRKRGFLIGCPPAVLPSFLLSDIANIRLSSFTLKNGLVGDCDELVYSASLFGRAAESRSDTSQFPER
jgi:hypothetical protein